MCTLGYFLVTWTFFDHTSSGKIGKKVVMCISQCVYTYTASYLTHETDILFLSFSQMMFSPSGTLLTAHLTFNLQTSAWLIWTLSVFCFLFVSFVHVLVQTPYLLEHKCKNLDWSKSLILLIQVWAFIINLALKRFIVMIWWNPQTHCQRRGLVNDNSHWSVCPAYVSLLELIPTLNLEFILAHFIF